MNATWSPSSAGGRGSAPLCPNSVSLVQGTVAPSTYTATIWDVPTVKGGQCLKGLCLWSLDAVCGAMDLVLSFLSTFHQGRKTLEHSSTRSVQHSRDRKARSACAQQEKKISCTSDTRCISELHPGVLHLHSSTHAATKITAIPMHQLGQHIFPPVASLGLQSITPERLSGST